MKRQLFYFTFLLLSAMAYSQNQANWWFFGDNAGLDFNSGVPVANNLGQLSTTEGCASIADACGALLFYTDGITVWNRNHTIMPNGMNLLGDPSSTQSAIIIPQPDSQDVYYIYTVGDFNPINGLNYSVVDMTLNGGLGDIVPAQKNINLIADSTEKIAAAVTSSGDAAWVITYAEEVIGSGIFNTIYAFKLTASGMDLSATAATTFNNVQADDRRGYLRIAPDGSQLALVTQLPVTPNSTNQTGRGAWLLDFNNTNGTASNPVRLNFPLTHQAYGAEFSPDSNKLYLDINTASNGMLGDRILLQYNLNDPNFSNSPVSIYATDPADSNDDVARGALQISPDNKIYYTRKSTEWLSIIDSPNQIGAASNFILDGVQVIAGTQVNEGLPPFYNAFFNPSFSFVEACQNNNSTFFADAIANCPGSSVVWDFGDVGSSNNTSTLPDPTHLYTSTGTFTVTLSITTIRGTYITSKDITIVPQPTVNPVNDILVCDDSSNDGTEIIDLTPIYTTILGTQVATDFQVTIHETIVEAQNDFNALPDNYSATTGTYFARIDSRVSNGCFETTSFDIIINQLPVINPIDDLYLCDLGNDGVENFDLNNAGIQALGNQDPLLFDVSFHNSMNDADSNSNALNPFYDNTSPNEIIWIRIENVNNTSCYEVDSFTLNLVQQPEIPTLDDIELCDDESNDGLEIFNLNQLNAQILGTQPASFNITYHNTMNEADSGMNPLASAIDSGSSILWIRLENDMQINCYEIAPVQLTVFPHPVVQLPQDILKCEDDLVTINATSGFAAYLWSNGETTSQIDITAAGNYTVTVTDSNGCTDSESITVSNYAPTIITNIAVRQFTVRDNRIEVSVTGSGPWEYSIDDFHYQSSPVFTGLLPGYYTVYVRSLNGCDFVTAPATIIAAPNFFTPNQDGFHDYWQVIAIETEPDANIYIFDRYGKLLKQISPTGPGWDGMYNGNPMPSSDYWFKVELNDGQSFRGHFSLKR